MEAGQKRIKLQLSGKLVYLVIQSILPYFAFCEKIKNPDSGNQDFTVFFSSRWCHQESNRGHKDFQSFALKTFKSLAYGSTFKGNQLSYCTLAVIL
jgi:hypothetical protein